MTILILPIPTPFGLFLVVRLFKPGILVDTRVLVDEENNTIKIIIFDSQESRQNRVRKKQILNIQEFRPGRSAMQGHCGLRLFLKVTVQYTASW